MRRIYVRLTTKTNKYLFEDGQILTNKEDVVEVDYTPSVVRSIKFGDLQEGEETPLSIEVEESTTTEEDTPDDVEEQEDE